MRKIKLELEALVVDTFATLPDQGARQGTVLAHYTGANWGVCGEATALCGSARTQPGACIYPSTSCAPGQTAGEATCYCLYPNTDERVCCSADAYCTGSGGLC